LKETYFATERQFFRHCWPESQLNFLVNGVLGTCKLITELISGFDGDQVLLFPCDIPYFIGLGVPMLV